MPVAPDTGHGIRDPTFRARTVTQTYPGHVMPGGRQGQGQLPKPAVPLVKQVAGHVLAFGKDEDAHDSVCHATMPDELSIVSTWCLVFDFDRNAVHTGRKNTELLCK